MSSEQPATGRDWADKPKSTVSGDPPEDGQWDGPAPQPIDPSTGQHGDHYVLPAEERAKGFLRPVRRSYVHKTCGSVTSMPQAIAETYARDPSYYGLTFCCKCRDYLPVSQFVWESPAPVQTKPGDWTGFEQVGS